MKRALANTWVEVSRRALIHNIRAHRRLIGKKVKLMVIVKANAYGHGIELVSQIAQDSKLVDWFGVASLTEAKQIRQAKIDLPILILSFFSRSNNREIVWAINNKVSFVVYEYNQLKALESAAKLAGRPARVHLKLDTGMARLGIEFKAANIFFKKIVGSKYLYLEGIASHLATAELMNQHFLYKQLSNFKKFVELNNKFLPSGALQHLACSAAISTSPATHLSLVRLGIAMYGLWPSYDNKLVLTKKNSSYNLKPVLSWKTQVISVQKLTSGTPVGYGRTYITRKPTVMAVLPVGYWDGLDRGLSNKGYVIIKGKRCKIIGRVCMNITMVDATSVSDIKVGDQVVLIGQQGRGVVTVDDMATALQTINYEIVTRINPRIDRIEI